MKDGIYVYRNYDKVHVNKYGCAEGEAILSGSICFVKLKNGRCFVEKFLAVIKKLTEK
jgi:hypothetical protein